MANLRDEFGVEAKNILAQRASILRARVSSDYDSFPELSIDLQSGGPGTRLAYYEPGHVFGVRYLSTAIPSEDVLIADLYEMLRLYALATIRGGTQELETGGHAVSEMSEEYLANISIEEKRRLRFHLRIERNPKLSKLAKKVHGFICKVCGFDFERAYGELGRGYIEAHHLTPLSILPPNQPVTLSPVDDFAVVCSNCHKMIHITGAPSTFEAFCQRYNRYS